MEKDDENTADIQDVFDPNRFIQCQWSAQVDILNALECIEGNLPIPEEVKIRLKKNVTYIEVQIDTWGIPIFQKAMNPEKPSWESIQKLITSYHTHFDNSI